MLFVKKRQATIPTRSTASAIQSSSHVQIAEQIESINSGSLDEASIAVALPRILLTRS